MKALQPIRRKQDFQMIFKNGRYYRGVLLNIWLLKNKSVSENECLNLAILVSRKVAAKAVSRNKWRRRIREIVRRSFAKIFSGNSLIVQVRSKKSASFSEIERELKTLSGKAL